MNLKEAQKFTTELEVEVERIYNMNRPYVAGKDEGIGDIEFKNKLNDLLNNLEELNLLLIELENSIPRQKVKYILEKLINNGHWEFLECRDLELTQKILQNLLENK